MNPPENNLVGWFYIGDSTTLFYGNSFRSLEITSFSNEYIILDYNGMSLTLSKQTLCSDVFPMIFHCNLGKSLASSLWIWLGCFHRNSRTKKCKQPETPCGFPKFLFQAMWVHQRVLNSVGGRFSARRDAWQGGEVCWSLKWLNNFNLANCGITQGL